MKKYTQEYLKSLVDFPKFTKDTPIFDGMRIYSLFVDDDGELDLIADEIITAPTDDDWYDYNEELYSEELWDTEGIFWKVEDQEDKGWNILSVNEIFRDELSQKNPHFIVTYN